MTETSGQAQPKEDGQAGQQPGQARGQPPGYPGRRLAQLGQGQQLRRRGINPSLPQREKNQQKGGKAVGPQQYQGQTLAAPGVIFLLRGRGHEGVRQQRCVPPGQIEPGGFALAPGGGVEGHKACSRQPGQQGPLDLNHRQLPAADQPPALYDEIPP